MMQLMTKRLKQHKMLPPPLLKWPHRQKFGPTNFRHLSMQTSSKIKPSVTCCARSSLQLSLNLRMAAQLPPSLNLRMAAQLSPLVLKAPRSLRSDHGVIDLVPMSYGAAAFFCPPSAGLVFVQGPH